MDVSFATVGCHFSPVHHRQEHVVDATRPAVHRLSLYEALDGDNCSPACDARRASLGGSTTTGHSESSLSEGSSSHGGNSPRTDEHPAVAAASKPVLSLKLAPSKLRRRQRMSRDEVGHDGSMGMMVSPSRSRTTQQTDSIYSDFSESPDRGLKEHLPAPPLATSSSPVRARVGPRGIMSTEATGYRTAPMPARSPIGDASNRGIVGLNPMCTSPVASSGGGDASTRIPPHTLGFAMQQQHSPVSREPCSPCRQTGGAVGIMSTTPSTASHAAMIAVPALMCPGQSSCEYMTSPTGQHETDVLQSMLGVCLSSGDDLAAQLMAAAPEVYED